MSFYYSPFMDFQCILKLFPNLKHLSFSTISNDWNFTSARLWQQFISTNLLKLEKLQFYITIDDSWGKI